MTCILSGVLFITGCKGCKDPVDEALNATLDFSGIYENSDGYEIELELDNETGSAEFTKVPAQSSLSVLEVGDPFMMSMVHQDDGSWRGSARPKSMGPITLSDVRFSGGTMTVTPLDGSGAHTFTKTTGSGTGGTGNGNGNGNGNGSGTGSGGDTILKQKIGADAGKGQNLTFEIPKGTKSMTVTTFESNTYERNSGDLFIAYNKQPKITFVNGLTPTYTWENVDYKSMNVNRANEICTVSNPQDGTWHATGFNPNVGYVFSGTIAVIIKK